jgi:nucleotide-binding universal stress UspA family protein
VYKKILVPLDGSDLAEAVLAQAGALAQSVGAEIVLLRVLVPHVIDRPPSLNQIFPDAIMREEEQAQQHVQEYLERVARPLQASGVRVNCAVRVGQVAEAILDDAAKSGVDLIAMSTHGRSGLSRWIIGGVADKVLRGANVPVLLVRPTGALSFAHELHAEAQ